MKCQLNKLNKPFGFRMTPAYGHLLSVPYVQLFSPIDTMLNNLECMTFNAL